MKHITKIAAATLIAAAAILAAGCKNDPRRPEFGVIEDSQTFPAGRETLKLDFRFEYITWYTDANVMRTIQASQISDFFGPEFLHPNPLESSKAWTEAMADSTSAHGNIFAGGGTLSLRSTSEVVNDRLVAFTVHRNEAATLGAHGLETTHYFNYDLHTGARLMLRDVFTPEGLAALPEVIRREILKKHGTADWDALVREHCYFPATEIAPTENFRLTAERIEFIYNPYDIACYAEGSTEISVPLGGLAGFNSEILTK